MKFSESLICGTFDRARLSLCEFPLGKLLKFHQLRTSAFAISSTRR
ncbi:hypothetical protein TcasGA2_TC034470 [Tribolium castaneum]|uniref:Uncharacterized protein n=1 Tax=Tribolium castaneum TaxID=7070 RepID=A0A139WC14_TRICA|nr:hypothetical protein TcasGA2_TC034470 [Tribolium castaneum]